MPAFNSIGTMNKICASCMEEKPITEFYVDLSHRDGLHPTCKKCHSKSVKKWQMKNALRFKELNRNWKRAHKKQRADKHKEWARAHPDQARERRKRSQERHPETSRNWRENHKDKIRNYQLTRRARMAGNAGRLTVEAWNAILDFYGHKCLCCGRGDVKLTVDHVIPIVRGGTHTADNVQPLCGPSNSRKKDKYIDYRKEYYAAACH